MKDPFTDLYLIENFVGWTTGWCVLAWSVMASPVLHRIRRAFTQGFLAMCSGWCRCSRLLVSLSICLIFVPYFLLKFKNVLQFFLSFFVKFQIRTSKSYFSLNLCLNGSEFSRQKHSCYSLFLQKADSWRHPSTEHPSTAPASSVQTAGASGRGTCATGLFTAPRAEKTNQSVAALWLSRTLSPTFPRPWLKPSPTPPGVLTCQSWR